jgi:5-methylcytosine-specific restriction endonuclease McrA
MKPVTPTTKTTLVLSGGFEPLGFFNARSTMRNLVVGAVKAYDPHGNIHDWSSWIANDTGLPEDYPCMRTADVAYAVPTIVVIPGYFNSKRFLKRRRKTIKLRQLYNIYDRKCQYCLKEIPYSVATRDHVVPRSRGGDNHDSNIVLSCKKCNLRKGSKFPYSNVFGSSVVPKILTDVEFSALSDSVHHRAEWDIFVGNPREQTLAIA